MRGGDQIPGGDPHRRQSRTLPRSPPPPRLAPGHHPPGPVRIHAERAATVFPAHFRVVLMVPSPADFAKNHQFTSPDTFWPNSRLTSSAASRDRSDPATCSAASATPAAARQACRPCAHPAAHLLRHQVTLGGFEHHLRAVIEREPHEFGNRAPQRRPRAAHGPQHISASSVDTTPPTRSFSAGGIGRDAGPSIPLQAAWRHDRRWQR